MAVSQGVMIKSVISAIDFLDQREIDPNVYDVSRDRAFTDIMKVVNRTKATTMPTYHNFVNESVRKTCVISSVTSTGLAQIVVVVNTNVAFPRKGDLVKSSNPLNKGKQALVVDVSATSSTATLTLRSVGGNSEPLFASADDILSFGSNAVGEKSDAPTNRRYGLTKYYNKVQAFREIDQISDIQKVSAIEVNFGGQYYILPYQKLQKAIKLKGDISYQYIAGVQSVTDFSDVSPFLADPITAANLPTQTTGGLDWYVTTYGIDAEVATLGSFDFDDFDEIIDGWISAKAPLNQMAFHSSRPKGILDQFFKNLGSAGVTSVRMNIDGRNVDMEVDQVKYRGAVIEFVHIPILDNPDVFSSDLDADINGSLYFVPKDQIDTVENGRQPRMQIRYMKSPFSGGGANYSSDGLISEWMTGAMAPVPTDNVMALTTNWYTVQGLECLGVEHFQKYRVI